MKKLLIAILPVLMFFNTLNAQNMPSKNGDYDKVWIEILSLEEQGLPKSAREKVDSLFIVAKADNNPSQIIKTLIFRSKYMSELEEDGFVKAINEMRLEMEKASFPTKAILQSMLGELYAGYLENNVWRFRNRTATNELKPEDIRTWDIEKLNAEAALLYRESIKNDASRMMPIANFSAITNQNTEGGTNCAQRFMIFWCTVPLIFS